jgi:hypothetical protein
MELDGRSRFLQNLVLNYQTSWRHILGNLYFDTIVRTSNVIQFLNWLPPGNPLIMKCLEKKMFIALKVTGLLKAFYFLYGTESCCLLKVVNFLVTLNLFLL